MTPSRQGHIVAWNSKWPLSQCYTYIHNLPVTFQEATSLPAGHPVKGVPLAVAEDEGSESDDDELKPKGTEHCVQTDLFVL